jgi:hypothetical protein
VASGAAALRQVATRPSQWGFSKLAMEFELKNREPI